jgi:serine phosphatase RsbU (regulator of sigma subunit)/tetratricopeptide (TPR) repeat protein
MNGEGYNEINRESEIIADANLMELFMFYLNKLKIKFYYGEYLTAYSLTKKMLPILKIPVGSLHLPEFHFYQSLIIAAVRESLSKSEKKQAMKCIRSNLKYFKKLSGKNESNFLHKYLFLLGEFSIIKRRHLNVIEYLYRSIKLARENGYNQDAAIFNMRTGIYYISIGQTDLGDYHLMKAHKLFLRWGADAICSYLLEKYPHLANKRTDISVKEKSGSSVTSSGSANDLLDISTVIKASQAISGEIRIEKLLETLMNIIMENAGAQKGAIIFERERSLVIEVSGSIKGKIDVGRVPITEESTVLPNSLINYVNKTRETLVLDDASNYSLFLYDKYIIKNNPKSVLCLPFTGKGEAKAILYLENNLITGGFTADRIQLLRILLSQAAISIENTRLVSVEMQNAVLEREIMMAQNIQNSLLPERLPATDKIEAAYRYIPMMGVGGDFISVKHWPESDKVGLFICDVSGHGIPAAFTSTMVSMALDFLWRSKDDNPKNVLIEIKKLLEGKMAGSFFTVCICVVDLKNRTAAACNAGHPPMIHLSKNGESRYIKVKGRMINETFAANHEVIVFKMEPGDRLVLYTDGITEACAADGSMLGDDDRHFLNWVKEHSDSSHTVDDLCSNIFRGVKSFAGRDNVDDDITILAAEFF